MPYRFDSSSDPFRVICEGSCSIDDCDQALYRIFSAEGVADRIVDFRSVKKFDFASSQVLLKTASAGLEIFPSRYRCAIVANRPLGIGIARMWQNLNECREVEIGVFQKLEEAERWVRGETAPEEEEEKLSA